MSAVLEIPCSARDATQVSLALLGVVDRENIPEALRLAGYCVDFFPLVPRSTSASCAIADYRDIILIDVSTQPHGVVLQLKALNAAIGLGTVRPRLLCFSTVHRNPNFVIDVQRCGARYVRISDAPMLLEALELMLQDMEDLEHRGPVFRITHRFSQGICAPGEEVSAVELLHAGDYFHLPLALTERLVVQVLAQHQRVALDSSQIVSTISGDWFFRDHAANSGYRQTRRLRRPTVKVSVERIRDAMSSVFGRSGLTFDPYDVVRSCPAEGTNRVLYRLHGRIDWHHPSNAR